MIDSLMRKATIERMEMAYHKMEQIKLEIEYFKGVLLHLNGVDATNDRIVAERDEARSEVASLKLELAAADNLTEQIRRKSNGL